MYIYIIYTKTHLVNSKNPVIIKKIQYYGRITVSTNAYSTVKQIEDHLEISTRYHPKGVSISNHWHDYFEFELVLDGAYEHTVSGEKRVAKRGSAWVMSHLGYHSLYCLSDAIILNISFTGDDIDTEITNILSSSAGSFLCEFDEETTQNILRRCENARREMSEAPPFWKCSVKGAVHEIIITALRNSHITSTPFDKGSPKILQSITSYLHKNYKDDLTLAAVAKKFNVSSGHLGLLFGKTFSISFNSYVSKIRLRQACNMLTNSDLSTKEIASACGFNSNEYFFYSFKKNLDMTPKEYRNSSRQ